MPILIILPLLSALLFFSARKTSGSSKHILQGVGFTLGLVWAFYLYGTATMSLPD